MGLLVLEMFVSIFSTSIVRNLEQGPGVQAVAHLGLLVRLADLGQDPGCSDCLGVAYASGTGSLVELPSFGPGADLLCKDPFCMDPLADLLCKDLYSMDLRVDLLCMDPFLGLSNTAPREAHSFHNKARMEAGVRNRNVAVEEGHERERW